MSSWRYHRERKDLKRLQVTLEKVRLGCQSSEVNLGWCTEAQSLLQLHKRLQSTHSVKKWWSVTQSCLTLCNPRTVACQGPLFMGFPRQEYWRLPFLFQGIFLTQGSNLEFDQTNVSPALADTFFIIEVPEKQSLKKLLWFNLKKF